MPGYLSDDGLVLATTVLDYFEMHPEEHKQDVWWCATGCCFAGGLARAVGAEPVSHVLGENDPWSPTSPASAAGRWHAVEAVDRSGRGLPIPQIARAALGLPETHDGKRMASTLFHVSNDLSDLRRMIDELAAGQEPTIRYFLRNED